MHSNGARDTHCMATEALRLAGCAYDKLASILCANSVPTKWLKGSLSLNNGSEEGGVPLNPGGGLHHAKDLMLDVESQEFLKEQQVAHVGTKDPKGWPYVASMMYVYEGGNQLYFHTGNCRGHFGRMVQHDPRVCVEVSRIGALHRDNPNGSNYSLEYTRVVAFGTVSLVEEVKTKEWFFKRLLAKYGDPDWTFEAGYPLLDQVILYELEMELLKGKSIDCLEH